MAAPYVGNNDFRGYLNYLSQNGDTGARDALNYTGNLGGIDSNGFESFYDTPTGNRDQDRTNATKYVQDQYAKFNQLQKPTAVLGESNSAPNTQSLIDQFNTGLGGVRGGADDAYNAEYTTEHNKGQGLIDSIMTGQKGINTSRENNELNRLNGIQDILGFVRNGLQSGASRLAQMNASDSSGNEALARAYNRVGAGRSNSINNQAVIAGRNIDTNQDALDLQRTRGLSDISDIRNLFTSNTRSSLRDKVTQLNQQAIGAGIGNRVGGGEVDSLIGSGASKLAPIDSWIQSQLSGIGPQSNDVTHANAMKLQSTGFNTGNPFSTGLPNGGQQVQGPMVDQLPIFTGTNKRQIA